MGKKQKCPEFENHERWLVSYADMVTLLFAVFVVLYALSQAGSVEEKEDVAGSIQESFNIPMEEIPLNLRFGMDSAGWGIFEYYHGDQITTPDTSKLPGHEEKVHILDDELEKVQQQIEERLYGGEKFRQKDGKGVERIVSVHRNQQGYKLRLLARHFFSSGGIEVSSAAKNELGKVTEILKKVGRRITIEGHTDNIDASGKFSNWEISALRAASVAKYMIKEHNFPVTLISIAGYGQVKPIAHNGSETGRSMNRRIEIQVHLDSEYGIDAPQ